MQFVWNTILSTLPVIKLHFLAVLAFSVVEFVVPARRKLPFRENLYNVQHVLLYFFVTPFAMILPIALIVSVTRQFGPGLINLDLDGFKLGLGSVEWPLRNILLPFIPILIIDFFYYWHHRLQHSVPALWATHRLHHGIENLNALGAYRVHWIEEPMRVITVLIPMSLIVHMTPVQGAWIGLALAQWGTFIHANIRLPYGPLTAILTGPQLHRMHHSIELEHHNKNYAGNFPVWDIVFGTYLRPKPGEWPATGLGSGETTGSVLKETAYPFVAIARTSWSTLRSRRVHPTAAD